MLRRELGVIVFLNMVACLGALGCNDDGDNDGSNGTGGPENQETDADAGKDSEDDTGTGEGEDIVTGTVKIPEAFDGDASMLGTMFFADLTSGGMPDGIGDTLTDLEAEPGGTIDFTTSQNGLEGEYYLAVVLYCEGGGGGQFPVAGVDWIGGTAEPLTLGPGTGTVDAGEIEIFLNE
jgi:hypothetical protein